MIGIVQDVIRRIRQHHAIEHATLHMLSQSYPNKNFSGYSDPLGFTVYGDVTEAQLRRAVGDGLLRLQAGERYLAIHPFCGTNLASSAVLATMAAFVAANSRQGTRIDRFVWGVLLVLASLVAAKPLGLWLQEYTTSADVADRWVARIDPVEIGPIHVHRVVFD
jgi:hypothetical protein